MTFKSCANNLYFKTCVFLFWFLVINERVQGFRLALACRISLKQMFQNHMKKIAKIIIFLSSWTTPPPNPASICVGPITCNIAGVG